VIPPFLSGLFSLLIGAGPLVALCCFVVATISFRSGGGTNFELGSGFVQWLFWGMVFLSLPALPALMSAAGIPMQPPSTGAEPAYISGLQTALAYFVNTYLLNKIVPLAAGALVLKALFDSAEEKSPIPSLVSAMLVLSTSALWTMATAWNLSSDATGVSDGLLNMVNWFGSNVCPAVGALCVIGAVFNYVTGKRWGHLAITSIAMMCFSGVWLLVQRWG
jgi:hypothetical protein